MPPRKTTDFGALFESLIEDLRIQVAASVDRTLSDFSRRLARIERRLDQLDPEHASQQDSTAQSRRMCSLCDKASVARGLCSAHYQQWRYRERKNKLASRIQKDNHPLEVASPALLLAPSLRDVSQDN